MLEYSSEANAYSLVKQEGGKLPKPGTAYLKNAEIYALGFGIGLKSIREVHRLEAIWEEYFNKAGVSHTIYLTSL